MHLARTTPPRLASDSLLLFDDDVRHCFSSCGVIDIPDEAWKQAQLCLSFGGLGIRSTILHSSAVYIASLSISGFGHSADQNLMQAVDHFNSLVLPSDVISVESVLNAPVLQRDLSKKIDLNLFQSLHACSFPHHLQTELVFSLSQLPMLLLGSQSLLLYSLGSTFIQMSCKLQ